MLTIQNKIDACENKNWISSCTQFVRWSHSMYNHMNHRLDIIVTQINQVIPPCIDQTMSFVNYFYTLLVMTWDITEFHSARPSSESSLRIVEFLVQQNVNLLVISLVSCRSASQCLVFTIAIHNCTAMRIWIMNKTNYFHLQSKRP